MRVRSLFMGGIIKIETGEIDYFDPVDYQFKPLTSDQ